VWGLAGLVDPPPRAAFASVAALPRATVLAAGAAPSTPHRPVWNPDPKAWKMIGNQVPVSMTNGTTPITPTSTVDPRRW
jgi:hypothetical protein